MKDSFAQRVLRVVASGANAVLDAVEDAAPEAVLAQMIRELDSVASEVRTELGRVLALRHISAKRLAEASSEHESLSGNLEVALAEQREDLAEAAISKQLDIEAQLPLLEHSLADADASEKQLDEYLTALAARRHQLVDELVKLRTAGGPRTTASERVSRTQAPVLDRPVAPAVLPEPSPSMQLTELDELARRRAVRERLVSLKAKKPSSGEGSPPCSR